MGELEDKVVELQAKLNGRTEPWDWPCVQRSRMSDQPPPRDATTNARQGETTGVVRWVLGIFLTLVIVGMVIAFLVSVRVNIVAARNL